MDIHGRNSKLTFHTRRNTTRHTTKKTRNVMAKADQNTTGTNIVNVVRFVLYSLKSAFLSDGNTPLLYLSDVSMAFGIKKAVIPRRVIMLTMTAAAIARLILLFFV
jgi:hypothetical protein